MLCARVMRGISSIEKSVAPVAASARIACGAPSGSAKPMTACPDRSSRRLSRRRTHLEHDVGRLEHLRARHDRRPLRAIRLVRESRRDAGALFDDDFEPAFIRAATAAGMTATRVSPGHVSFGMPTFMAEVYMNP